LTTNVPGTAGELFRFGAREKVLGHGERVVDQLLRHAVIGDDEKPGVFAGASDRTRQRRCRSRLAGEIRADIEHRNAALARGLGLGGSEIHVMSHNLCLRGPRARRAPA